VAYRHYQQLIAEVGERVRRFLSELPVQVDPIEQPIPEAPNPRRSLWRNEPLGLREDLYRAFGVDLTRVPGLNSLTVQMLLIELVPTSLPQCCGVCLLVTPLPGQAGQRREGAFVQERSNQNRTARWHSEWQHRASTIAELSWGSTTVACAPALALPKPLPPLFKLGPNRLSLVGHAATPRRKNLH
jgi:hypothetical protein